MLCVGLSHLVGTNLLRAYMHGYFMDVRLYHKVGVSDVTVLVKTSLSLSRLRP